MLVTALALFAALTLCYYLFIGLLWNGLLRLRPAGEAAGETYSVLIAARNEEKTIGACIESVLHQTMAAERFEVVVVDDRSDDHTPHLLAQLAQRHERLTVIRVESLPEGISPKKNALMLGLAAVGNPIVACTDADCVVPPTWLDTIDHHFSPRTGLVQGITTYRPMPRMNQALYVFQSLDFLSHGVVSAAAIGANLPLNANGNNIAWRTAAFKDVGGYGASRKVLLGDDDLLLQRVHRDARWEVRYMADRHGAVLTEPETTFGGMLRQRARWGSVSVHYGPGRVALLAGVFLFFCAIPSALLLGLLNPLFFLFAAAMVGAKAAGELLVMIPGAARFGQTRYLAWLPLISVPHLALVLLASFMGVLGVHEWKGHRGGGTLPSAGRAGDT